MRQQTASRGRSYQRSGHVSSVYQISDDIICGSVEGTKEYDTVVSVSVSDSLSSRYTCPVRSDCKHGVALMLEYLERLKRGILCNQIFCIMFDSILYPFGNLFIWAPLRVTSLPFRNRCIVAIFILLNNDWKFISVHSLCQYPTYAMWGKHILSYYLYNKAIHLCETLLHLLEKNTVPGRREHHLGQNEDQKRGTYGHVSRGRREIKKPLQCIVIKESQKNEIMMKMSPDSIRILSETKWNEKGFIPSFAHTDKVLREASRRSYKTLGISDQWGYFQFLPGLMGLVNPQ